MTAISVARDCQMVKVSESVILIKAVNDENSDGIPTIIAEFIGEDSNFQNLNDTDKASFRKTNHLSHFLIETFIESFCNGWKNLAETKTILS